MKRGLTLIELLVVLSIVAILAAVLFPFFARTHHRGGRRSPCQSNLRQIGLGLLQYAQDNTERFPLVASNAVASAPLSYAKPYGWADAIQPYVKSTEILQCPSEDSDVMNGDATAPGFTDYYFNLNLDTRPQKAVANPTQLVMCGEGNDGRDVADARYARNAIPQDWLTTSGSPARRHLDTGNYLFADGHVKALPPGDLRGYTYTFDLKPSRGR